MQVSTETLRTTIGAASDEELLRRWGAQLFTEDALPIAEAELSRRGLNYSADNIERVEVATKAEIAEARSIQYVKFVTGLVVAAVGGGFAINLGLLGGLAGVAIAFPLGRMLATTIDRYFRSFWLRFVLGLVTVVVSLFTATFISLLVGTFVSWRA